MGCLVQVDPVATEKAEAQSILNGRSLFIYDGKRIE